LVGGLLLTACGTVTEAAQPTVAPQIVTQVGGQIVVVTQVVPATPRPATPTPKATAVPPTATTAPTATPNPIGKWRVSEEASSFDDSKVVVVKVSAEDEIQGPVESVSPSLVLRCQEGVKEAYIYTGMSPDVESGNLDGATIRFRFDKEPAQ